MADVESLSPQEIGLVLQVGRFHASECTLLVDVIEDTEMFSIFGGPLMDRSRLIRYLAYHRDVLEDFINQLPAAVLVEAFKLGLEEYLHNEEMKEIRRRLREMK